MSHMTDWHVVVSYVPQCKVSAVVSETASHLFTVQEDDYVQDTGMLEMWTTGCSYSGSDAERAGRLVMGIRNVIGTPVPVSVTATFVEHAPSETWTYS